MQPKEMQQNFSEPLKNSTEFSNELTFTNMFLVFTLPAQKIANATAHQMLVLNFSQTSRGSCLEEYIFSKIFSIYLVIQAL